MLPDHLLSGILRVRCGRIPGRMISKSMRTLRDSRRDWHSLTRQGLLIGSKCGLLIACARHDPSCARLSMAYGNKTWCLKKTIFIPQCRAMTSEISMAQFSGFLRCVGNAEGRSSKMQAGKLLDQDLQGGDYFGTTSVLHCVLRWSHVQSKNCHHE